MEKLTGFHSFNTECSKLHPLIDCADGIVTDSFTLNITGQEFYIADHIVRHVKLFPGAAYLEMVRAASELSGYGKVRKILSTVWAKPLVQSDKPIQLKVRTSVKSDRNYINYEIYTCGDSGDKVLHVQGKVLSSLNAPEDVGHENIDFFDIHEITSRCTFFKSSNECYKTFKNIGFDYGRAFQVVSNISFNENEAISRLELPEMLRGSLGKFVLHPSLIDGAFQSTLGLMGADCDAAFVPFALGELDICGRLPEVCYAYVTRADEGREKNSAIKKFCIRILDQSGQTVVKMDDFCVSLLDKRPVPAKEEAGTSMIMYYPSRMEKKLIGKRALNEPVMLLNIGDALSGAVTKQLCLNGQDFPVVNIKQGKEFRKLGERVFETNPDNPLDYDRLMDELEKGGNLPSRIIVSPSDADSTGYSPEKALNRMVFLTQAIMKAKLQNEVAIFNVFINGSGLNKVCHKALDGFNRTLALESRNIYSTTIEIKCTAAADACIDEAAEIILSEMEHAGGREGAVIWENGQRTCGCFKEVEMHENINGGVLRQSGVYIITGGMGGIGFIFARYLAQKVQARLVLVGRSALIPRYISSIRELESYGSEVVYLRGDISSKADVERITAAARSVFGEINGIIHSAGIIRDSFIARKTSEEIAAVLAPKVYGTINLDEAAKDDCLDLFVMFSSAAAVMGNMGQADYAYANSFMDHFAAARENLRLEGKRKGRTISINWPLWKDGGMKVEHEIVQMLENRTGVEALSTEMALKAFEQALLWDKPGIGVLSGNREKILKSLGITPVYGGNVNKTLHYMQNRDVCSKESLYKKAEKELLPVFAELIKVEERELDIDTDLMEYGLSSIMLITLLNRLEEHYNEAIEPNEVLNWTTIKSYAEYLVEKGMVKPEIEPSPAYSGNEWDDNVDIERYIPDKEEPDYNSAAYSVFPDNQKSKSNGCESRNTPGEGKKIAVISMACRFPKADSVESFWENIKNGVDAIREIPKERWDTSEMFSEDKSAPNRSYSKWGGFIDGMFSFDADFFKIPYQDALVMDPQQRIMLELAQELFDRAGYSKRDVDNTRTSVYIGARESSYIANNISKVPEASMKHIVVSVIQNMIPARISDFYNLRGVSQTIDTACSSSLVAIHQACTSILNGESDFSIAGGIDLLFDAFPFVAFSKADVLSDDGVSYVFDKKAKGFVLGEGAGLVLLKDYHTAVRDGDNILGVIAGSAVNNDGNTIGLTVPNQNAQKEVIEKALQTAGVCADSISYFEAHGTGTLLGDPIEVKAASLAFDPYTDEKEFCALGSVKSNIGHLQRAAGVASFIKVIAALNNGIIPPTLHCTEPHARFKFKETPFYPITRAKEWTARHGIRRSGISSFGFGGTNCHMIVEEFIPPMNYEKERHPLPITKFNRKLFRLGSPVESSLNVTADVDIPENPERDNNPHVYQYNDKSVNNLSEDNTEHNIVHKIEKYLTGKIACLLAVLPEDIDTGQNFMDMGIESIKLVQLADDISNELNIELYPTIFFEHQNMRDMACFFARDWNEAFRFLDNHENEEYSHTPVTETPHSGSTGTTNHDIAIIGMSGLFADSPDLDSFWHNLVEKKDLIREIPKERFDYTAWFDAEPQKPDKMYCKWGSFVQNVDRFDADFFRISPHEAQAMDPQLRLLLQVLYSTAEDAGYASSIRGTKTGMYVGACYRDYFMEMGNANKCIDMYDGTGNALTMLANRPSFYFDLKGPSISVDTACSSSLVALHLAVKALRDNECDTAFVSGVNLILSSWRFRYFCSIGALSLTGRCHTFDERADGYVPGEGVAAILIKPLEKAIRDGDRIHAVIKGTAVNNGGYTPSITAPSVNLEAQVILDAWKDANINPETIGYIEAHGTGTSLGDPIEIEAIKKAFALYTKNEGFCTIGSVKANIGHTEGAAGITGIIKTVLSMRHGKIPALPMFSKLNRYIKLDGSPLCIKNETHTWLPEPGIPRRAGVSSFGFGGTYAHTVLEEYTGGQDNPVSHQKQPRIFVLSARTDEQLRLHALRILEWLKKLKVDAQLSLQPEHMESSERDEFSEINLDHVAWTLQAGREAMSERLAFVADGWMELIENLEKFCYSKDSFCNSKDSIERILRGTVSKNDGEKQVDADKIKYLADNRDFGELARLWVEGAYVEWQFLYNETLPSFITMPFYPFAGERFWFVPDENNQNVGLVMDEKSDTHVLEENDASPHEGYVFTETISKDNVFAQGHMINGRHILPGAVCIEMMRAAGEFAGGCRVGRLSNVAFIAPIEAGEECEDIHVTLIPNPGYFECEIRTGGSEGRGIIYASGEVEPAAAGQTYPRPVELHALQSAMSKCAIQMTGDEIYRRFTRIGFYIAEKHRTVNEIHINQNEALAKLILSNDAGVDGYFLNPLLLDGAFHASLALIRQEVPVFLFHIGEIRIFQPLTETCFVHVSIAETADPLNIKAFVRIYDEEGTVLVTMDNIMGKNAVAARPEGIHEEIPAMEQAQPDEQTTPFVVHENDLHEFPHISEKISALFREYAREEAAAARKEIAPWIFMPADRSCCAYFNRNGSVLVMFNYMGPEERLEGLVIQLMDYCRSLSLEFEMVSDRKTISVQGHTFTATPFASMQRIVDLDKFGLEGKRMNRLRYMVSKFRNSGNCNTVEYISGSDAGIDNQILSMIDEWCASKTMVNSYIKRVKKQIAAGKLEDIHRIFLTHKDDVLQNVIIITRMPAGGYLMDLEFYPSEMPLGGLEYGITRIIKKLVEEGCKVFSLGVTWGVMDEQCPESDPETEKILLELREQKIFTGDGNFQFKNKFRPLNSALYLVHPQGNAPGNVEDVIMMIASPETPEVQSSEHPEDGSGTLLSVSGHASSGIQPIGHDSQSALRLQILEKYGFNPMHVPREHIEFDFVTDSWAELESDAIYRRLAFLQSCIGEPVDAEKLLKDIFPFPNIIITASGRIAESLLYESMRGKKSVVVQNLLFPTGIFHQINNSQTPLEIPQTWVFETQSDEIFKGNMDCSRLQEILDREDNDVAFACVEVGNNAAGGCPISLQNMKEVRDILSPKGIPIVMDATRILENACFISRYEKGYEGKDVWHIVHELLSCADHVVASLTKDFSINAGGIIATADSKICSEINSRISATGGGLNAVERKLVGITMKDKDYLIQQVKNRMEASKLLWDCLTERNVPVARPSGGHCVLVDAGRILGSTALQYPLHSFTAWLFCNTGIRAAAHSAGLKKDTPLNRMIRLAVPIGTGHDDIKKAAERIARLFNQKEAMIPDLVIEDKHPGLFGEAKAKFKVKGYAKLFNS